MQSFDTLQKSGALAGLRQFAQRRAAVERCEMCSKELGSEHAHLVEIEKRRLLCACEACSLLFTSQAGTKLRSVPKRARFLPNFRLSNQQWQSLMIPIEMAFFFESTPHRRVVAFYPSPGGAMESLLTFDTWGELRQENPLLAEMIPDVEALLVNRAGASNGVRPQYFIAPIDQCYRLVGLIRTHWRGFSGGTEVWREITLFFTALRAKSVGQGGANA